MKKFLLLLLFIGLNSYAQQSKLIASCCAGERGRCSGTASCTACSNCSGCKHCAKEGGTCGVCSGSAPRKKANSRNSSSTTGYSYRNNSVTSSGNNNSNTNTSTNSFVSSSERFEPDQYIHVSSETVNVRVGAGSDFEIVAKLKKGTALQFISSEGDWILVKVPTTGKFGYVYYKYVGK